VHDIHKKINDKIAQSNVNYKLQAEVIKRLKTFNVSDYVMISPEWFPLRTVKKLHAHSAGPFQILNKLNDNAYVKIFLNLLVLVLLSILIT